MSHILLWSYCSVARVVNYKLFTKPGKERDQRLDGSTPHAPDAIAGAKEAGARAHELAADTALVADAWGAEARWWRGNPEVRPAVPRAAGWACQSGDGGGGWRTGPIEERVHFPRWWRGGQR